MRIILPPPKIGGPVTGHSVSPLPLVRAYPSAGGSSSGGRPAGRRRQRRIAGEIGPDLLDSTCVRVAHAKWSRELVL
jgi:hypothetical protein